MSHYQKIQKLAFSAVSLGAQLANFRRRDQASVLARLLDPLADDHFDGKSSFTK
jgi:hypothetical protein